eukprot:NODE_9618_length_1410_cov_10.179267.p1 GENE.NODE_9618_length_1410_cov_10.179267~~NODE_9618_length_1410_cov_10.179267.p1  ORF type:complete len:374 (-),score=83.16 NODE_9618_length_1410_cov_10.179267:212-1333(-)
MTSIDGSNIGGEDNVALIWTVVFIVFCLGLVIGPAVLPPRSAHSKLFVWLAVWSCGILPMLAGVLVPPLVSASVAPGYWAIAAAWWHGRIANHDFCEENYVYSRFVAEFHNTWSSLPIIAVSVVGTWYARRYADLGPRVSVAFITVGLVGIGSTMFHSMMLNWAQLLDEAPMLCFLCALLYCMAEPGQECRFPALLAPVLLTACVGFVVAYVVFNQYLIFLVGFTGGAAFLVIYVLIFIFPIATRIATRTFLCAFFLVLVGFGCWLLDEHLCSVVWWARLHIIWHYCAALTAYTFVFSYICYSAACCGKTVALRLPRPTSMLCPRRNGLSGYGGWRVMEYMGGWSWAPCEAPDFFLPFMEVFDGAPPARNKHA